MAMVSCEACGNGLMPAMCSPSKRQTRRYVPTGVVPASLAGGIGRNQARCIYDVTCQARYLYSTEFGYACNRGGYGHFIPIAAMIYTTL